MQMNKQCFNQNLNFMSNMNNINFMNNMNNNMMMNNFNNNFVNNQFMPNNNNMNMNMNNQNQFNNNQIYMNNNTIYLNQNQNQMMNMNSQMNFNNQFRNQFNQNLMNNNQNMKINPIPNNNNNFNNNKFNNNYELPTKILVSPNQSGNKSNNMSNLIKIKIFLSTGNNPYKIKVCPTETIKSVLKLFTDQFCPMIKNKIQNVCYSGQQLDINKTFQDYNISTNSKILLIICDQNKKSHQNFNINQGYIIGVFDIPKGLENSNIRIINSYEAVQREKKFQQQQNQMNMNQMQTQQQTTANNQTNNNFEFLQENRNEKEIRKCVIEIEDISGMNNNGNQMVNNPQTGVQTSQAGHKIPFSYVYKFQKVGKFKVKYSFNNIIL